MTILELDDLGVRYGRRQVLTGVSLTVEPGEVVGVIGETGSGKSTLARAVLGLVRASTGRVVVDGEDVTTYRPRQWRALRRRGVAQYVFQDPLRSLDPDLSILDSLAEPLLVRGDADAESRVRDFLPRVRLGADLLDRLPGQLSGGQRQRVALARALVTEPRLVLLDEPVSALDAATRVQVLDILKGLRAGGTALVFISHDLGSVAGLADRIAVLHDGELVETGPTRDVLTRPDHPYTRRLIGSVPTLRGARRPLERTAR